MSFIAKGFVDLAYFLQTSKSYQATKTFFYSLLEDDSNPYKKYFDYMMMLFILSSVMLLIRQVKYPLNEYAVIYNDYLISLIFLVEYLLRFWVHSSVSEEIIHQYEKDEFLGYRFRLSRAIGKILKEKWRYVSSYFAIIDLLAIMPFFHQLRILRLFILFRAFKIFRYTKSLQQFAGILGSMRFEFFTLMIFASVMISVSSVLIYVAEANNTNSAINTIFEAFYWSFVTLSTVGYGDFVPVTSLGRSVAMVIIVSGIAVISFMTSIVVSALSQQLEGIKEQKMITDISKMNKFYLVCGFSEVSSIVMKRLQKDGIPFVLLDKDPQKIVQATKAKIAAVLADPSKQESYENFGIDIRKQVISVLCLEETDVQNIYTALTIRSIDPDVSILSYLHENKNRKKLSLAGVNNIIYPQELIGILAHEFTGKPVAFEAINALRSQISDVVIEEILINSRILSQRKCVEDLKVHASKLTLLGIYRDRQFHFNPPMEMALHDNDILIMIGVEQMIKEFSLNLHKKKGDEMKPIAVFGYNEYAKEIASNFKRSGVHVFIYAIDEASVKRANEDGYDVELVELDDNWLNIAEKFDTHELTCFCALDDDAQNVFLTISLRAQYPHLFIVALATSKDSANKLSLAGANKAIAKLETTANIIVECLEKPAVVEVMTDILYHNSQELKLAQYTISENSVLAQMKLHDISLHREYNIIILAIADKELETEFTFTSTGHNHKVDPGDVLVVMGKDEDLKKFEKAIK